MPEKDSQSITFETLKLAAANAFNKLPTAQLKKGMAIAGSVIAMSGVVLEPELVFPDKAVAEQQCTTESTTTTTTNPDGSTTTTTSESTHCTDTDESSSSSPDEPADKPDKPVHHPQKPDKNKDHSKKKEDNLLEVPENRTRRYWATLILNETLKGKEGRISASPEAEKNLYQARAGHCSPVEQVPGRCVKLDKTLLKVLVKASYSRKFYIWHFTGGPHVPNSHHFDGDATDLRRFDGRAPTNKSMFPILQRATPNSKSVELLGPGDNAAHTGPKNGHIHYAVY